MLPVDKPIGWTSSDVVRKVKVLLRRLGYRKIKIGHAGTLDPLASGVLLICIGRATKTIESLQAEQKEYLATFELGATTPSYDREHPIDRTFPYEHITEELVRQKIAEMIGEQMQLPPTFSAKMIDGKRAYEYDRSGNLKEVVYYLANSSSEFSIPQDSTSYVYDTSVSADNLVYPIDPEEPEDYEPYLKSQLNGYSIYNLEEYDMKLALTQVFVYNWGDFHPLGVDKAMTAEGSDVKVYVSGGTAFILGLEDKGCDYAIYDMMGRTVLSGQLAGGTVDVCPLHDGYYILSVDGHNVKFRR